MTSEQVFALLAFAAVVVTLTWALPTSRLKLGEDERQRSSMSPVHIALATLLGGGTGSSNGDHGAHNEGDSSDFDSGYDGGGGDGGGE